MASTSDNLHDPRDAESAAAPPSSEAGSNIDAGTAAPRRESAWYLLLAPIFAAGFLVPVLFLGYLVRGKTVMVRENPEGTQRARLGCKSWIDLNYLLSVDGETVYHSPDFRPKRFDYREQLLWDVSGRVVVFVVAERRIFGYDAAARKALTAEERAIVEFHPFERFGYEGHDEPPPL